MRKCSRRWSRSRPPRGGRSRVFRQRSVRHKEAQEAQRQGTEGLQFPFVPFSVYTIVPLVPFVLLCGLTFRRVDLQRQHDVIANQVVRGSRIVEVEILAVEREIGVYVDGIAAGRNGRGKRY